MKQVCLVLRQGAEYNANIARWLLGQLPSEVSVKLLTDAPQHEFYNTRCSLSLQGLKFFYPGWWSKMELFLPGTITEPTLYIDLDTVVFDLPAKWWEGTNSLMLDDFFFPERPASGMMLIQPKDVETVWRHWMRHPQEWMRVHSVVGDQELIGSVLPHHRFQQRFPEEIISYKAQVKPGHKFYDPSKGSLETAKVVCFHGKPRPWSLEEPWLPPPII